MPANRVSFPVENSGTGTFDLCLVTAQLSPKAICPEQSILTQRLKITYKRDWYYPGQVLCVQTFVPGQGYNIFGCQPHPRCFSPKEVPAEV